jgi:hypothetical protein
MRTDLDVHAALKYLLPNEDWTYLDTRKRQISEKAAEIERQKADEAATKRPRAPKKPKTVPEAEAAASTLGSDEPLAKKTAL